MTVRDAIQSIVALTGAQNVCACRDSSSGQALAEAAMSALNRAMQMLWASPEARSMTIESQSVTVTTSPTDLPASILKVVGRVKWNSMQPIPLAATETEFYNYFRDYVDEHWDEQLYDDLVFASSHNVSGSLPWYTVEFYLPLSDDRAVLVYFDNAANINTLNPAAATSPRGNALNSRTVLVRVELPHADTPAATARALVLWELKRKAGRFFDFEDRAASNAIRCYRLRPADVTDWTASTTPSISLSVTKGPRVPIIAWAEELRDTTVPTADTAKVRLHLLPHAAGTVTLNVTKEPPKYVFTDLDCDGDGLGSTEIAMQHGWTESILMPLARLAFAQDYPAWLTPQVAAHLPAMEAAAAAARETLGLSAPTSSQNTQRNQSPAHAHP